MRKPLQATATSPPLMASRMHRRPPTIGRSISPSLEHSPRGGIASDPGFDEAVTLVHRVQALPEDRQTEAAKLVMDYMDGVELLDMHGKKEGSLSLRERLQKIAR